MTLAGLALVLWVVNTSVFVDTRENETRLIAHRGVHQIYVGTDRTNDACHAAPVAPIRHTFIENTVPSMREAFRLGADVVEIDVHLTRDDVFAVFHDWTLDCRTEGRGVTHERTYAELTNLDVSYGIDDGSGTYPLRGKGRGLMPSLEDVLSTDLGGRFLVNFKSRRAREGVALSKLLDDPARRSRVWAVYGGAPPTREARRRLPAMRGFDRGTLRACLLRYFAFGWTSYVPEACRTGVVAVPIDYAPFLWGWPHRFTKRMEAAGTSVVLLGAYDGSGFSSGIDTEAAFQDVPDRFDGYVWTNRIEIIGPLLKAN